MSEEKLERKWKPQYARVPRTSPESPPDWPDPTPKMLETPEFNALWELMKTWDINVPTVDGEGLYTGATGNHVRAILDALSKVAVVIKIPDVRKIHGALCDAAGFFVTRDSMNSKIHLSEMVSSPITLRAVAERDRLTKILWPHGVKFKEESPEQKYEILTCANCDQAFTRDAIVQAKKDQDFPDELLFECKCGHKFKLTKK